jgi:uncharacterized membrane protein YGL010W
MSVMGRESWNAWIGEYAEAHKHPVNRFCHTFGIPLVALSGILVIPAIFYPRLWWAFAFCFGVGWAFQFVGHAFEGKPPEFLKDPRFLLVGLRWWFAKLQKRV